MKKAFKFLLVFTIFFLVSALLFTTNINAQDCPTSGPPGIGPDMRTQITDTNLDKVYYPGNTLQFEFEGIVNSTRDFLKVAFVVVTSEGTVNAEVINGLTSENNMYILELGETDITSTPLAGGLEKVEFDISGTIQTGVPMGAIATIIMTEANPETNIFTPLVKETTVAEGVRGMWTYYQGNPACETTKLVPSLVGIPSTFGNVSSNINQLTNLHNTEAELVFTRSMGSITFEPGLDVVSSWEELANLEDFITISYDSETNEMKIAVDTSSLTFLAEHGATIQFVGVADYLGLGDADIDEDNFRDYVYISVFDTQGEEISNPPFDWDNAEYDAETHTLTLPIDHFTEYALGTSYEEEASEEDEDTDSTDKTKTTTEATADDDELPETGRSIIVAFLLGFTTISAYALTKKYKLLK